MTDASAPPTTTATSPAPAADAAAGSPGAVPATSAPSPSLTTPAAIMIDGKELAVPELKVPLNLLVDEIDAHLASLEMHPIDAMVQALDRLQQMGRDDLNSKLVDAAYDQLRKSKTRTLNLHAVATWIRSADGLIWLVWRALKQQQPAIELSRVQAAMRKEASHGD